LHLFNMKRRHGEEVELLLVVEEMDQEHMKMNAQ
jgi:hypothetical protein